MKRTQILETIKLSKLKEVQEKKELIPIKRLEKSIFFDSECVSMVEYIRHPEKSGIIAEFKRKSPSKGDINKYADPSSVSIGYMRAGASGLSVLTDHDYFGAQTNDFEEVRQLNYCPILRKDFMIDEYQILESKSMGADVVLLIAKMLSPSEIHHLAAFAQSLGMQVLLETHNLQEIEDNYDHNVSLVGINNRNLNTFEVDINNSIELASKLPKEVIKVAESGIDNPEVIATLKQNGFEGFLIGEHFMRSSNPSIRCKRFIQEINSYAKQSPVT